MPDRLVSPATCLGCGCTCDDIALVIRDERIVEAQQACAVGVEWFGDGSAPSNVVVDGREASMDQALNAIAELVTRSKRALVYLAPDVTCEAQRLVVALADASRAMLDTITSAAASSSILAAQAMGRAGATLGEVRNAADVVVFWGVDPSDRYPRFRSRYAPDAKGVYVPEGRESRTVIAVDIDDARGPVDADLRVALERRDEVATLSVLAAIATRMKAAPTLEEIASVVAATTAARNGQTAAAWDVARQLAPLVAQARYAVFVVDAESSDAGSDRADALIRMTQTFNGPTRCALVTLRDGGNRTGADAVLTSQTGYPMAIDFAHGYPRYLPYDDAAARLARGEVDAALVIGSAAHVPADVLTSMSSVTHAVIGPRATESPLARGVAAIDTGIAGIHDDGTALRLDDVPLPLRGALKGPPSAADVIQTLLARVMQTAARKGAHYGSAAASRNAAPSGSRTRGA